jgi:superfamily II DNA or RNA helicase
MADDGLLALTPEERDHLENFQVKFVPQVMQRGRELFSKGAVVDVEWNESHQFISVIIEDLGEREKLAIPIGRLGIRAIQCSCTYSINCRHAAAAVMYLLTHSVKPERPPATQEKKPERAPILDQLLEINGRSKLPTAAARALPIIERWFSEKQRIVSESELFSISNSPQTWSYIRRDVVLYPKQFPPTNVMDLLCYVDYALREAHRTLPPGLQDGIDRERQNALVGEWERQKAIKEWRKRLSDWTEDSHPRSINAARFRIRLSPEGGQLEVEKIPGAGFEPVKSTLLREWGSKMDEKGDVGLSAGSLIALRTALDSFEWMGSVDLPPGSPLLTRALTALLGVPGMEEAVVAIDGLPLVIHPSTLNWRLIEPDETASDYLVSLHDEKGNTPPLPIVVTKGAAPLYITPTGAWPAPNWPFGDDLGLKWPLHIPTAALESKEGVGLVEALALPLPQKLKGRVITVSPSVKIRCRLHTPKHSKSEYFQIEAQTETGNDAPRQKWLSSGWVNMGDLRVVAAPARPPGTIVRVDRRVLVESHDWLSLMRLKPNTSDYKSDGWWERRVIGKDFPDEFLSWLNRAPEGVTIDLDAELASIRNGVVAGSVRLDVQESEQGMDWFDLRVALDMSDVSLLPAEVEMLLKAKGRWVRIEGKGWRKLEFNLTDEQEQELADMGLSVADLDGEPQRLHALQLASVRSQCLLSADRAEEVRRRVQDIQTRVMPPLPETITATLRPYQLAGFHFLAYLTVNQFGGILADDMGLGKTLQTLAWIAWLRETGQAKEPSLVICPKSVQDNWLAEAARFFPQLRVQVWSRDSAGSTDDCDLLVIHYQQLRLHEDLLTRQSWSAAILDEAQAIKNPTSQTNRAACSLRARFRLALTGTPIENRLMDLWAIMAFSMPGALGSRAHFTRHFDSKTDALARHRLSARVRPFLLRRTKKEVANDLPDRIEEDITCEMEGPQAALYKAELKRARASLLKVQTSKQLDKLRFNILTSLLRLRQICCHPALIGHDDPKTESAKLTALLELLEPLMDEGHKVLIFSQFVDMLQRIQTEVAAREWPHFILTGQTEDRGDLVRSFQESEGAGVFLISLKAGGSGLNLTAASYVVLFDPWWNPAVEAQAIDRTHRIGQKNTVIAYRLIVKESIEEKIRSLQKQKGHLAQDILGEENFAKALSIDDFRFLLGDD